jgi:WD40 repeat protein
MQGARSIAPDSWGRKTILVVLLSLAGGGSTPAASLQGKVLRETGRWGDGRFVAGETILSKAFSAGRLAVGTSRGVIVWDLLTLAEVWRTVLPVDRRHPELRKVALSPDGRRVTIASWGSVAIWDLRSGKRLIEMSWSGFERPGVALAPSGERAAVWEKPDSAISTKPSRVELFDLHRKTSHPVAADGPIWDLRFLDDSRSAFPLEKTDRFAPTPAVISPSAGRITDVRTPATAPCRTDKSEVCTLASPNGRWIVDVGRQPIGRRSGSSGPVPLVSVTDTKSRDRLVIAETEPLATQMRCSGDVCDDAPVGSLDSARVALDGRRNRLVAVISQARSGSRLEVWDLASRHEIVAAPLDVVFQDFVLSADGARMLVHESAGTLGNPRDDLAVYATQTGRVLWRHESIAWGIPADTRSETWIAEPAGLVTLLERPSDLGLGRLIAWDIETGVERVALTVGRAASGRPLVAGEHLAFPASSNGLTILSTRGGADLLPADRHAGAVVRLALSDDGALLASAGDDGKLIVRSLARRSAAHVVSADAIGDLAFAPGGHQVMAAGRLGATKWDGDTGTPLAEVRATLEHGEGRHVIGARLSPDHDSVGFFRDDHSLELRPWRDDQMVRVLNNLCFRGLWQEGASLAGPGWCGAPDAQDHFVLRELDTGQVRRRADGGAATSTWVIAADGRHLIYPENGGGVILGTTDVSQAPVRIHQPRVSLTAAAFTPDARLAVTALWDGTVHLWDAKTAVELDALDFAASLDRPTALAVSPKGDELFVGTERGIVYRFSIATRAH